MTILMKSLFTLTAVFTTASLASAGTPRTGNYPSTYHTAIYKQAEMICGAGEVKNVIAPDKSIITQMCKKEYYDCMFYGSCLIENTAGKRIGISFYRYDEEADQSYFDKTDLGNCPYGYGVGKVSERLAGTSCLIPYFSVAADPLEHSLGEVIFLPFLVGVQLPTGEVHDGYMIITDSSTNTLGTGYDQYDFFTGSQSKSDISNAFTKTKLGHPDNTFPYEVITGTKAEEIRQQRGFKVLKTYKRTFKPKKNEMVGG